jgi:RNA polymerase sigma factor (sigma-70 family)
VARSVHSEIPPRLPDRARPDEPPAPAAALRAVIGAELTAPARRRTRLDPARHAGSALLSGQSDERLVQLARGGNERAFEAIVHRHRRALLRHCARVLPAPRAEDAVQQTFVKAHTALRDGDAEIQLRPWLYKIARNTSLNLLRENGWTHEPLDERIDGVERPPEAFERRERFRATIGALQRLPRRQRDAIVLRELEGRSYDEIARTLTVSDGAVRQLINRARTTLRAGVTAITPTGLLARLAGAGSAMERASVAGAGAGGIAGIAKLSAGILVGGALVAGGGSAVLHSPSRHARHAASIPAAAAGTAAGAPGVRVPDRRGTRGSPSRATRGGVAARRLSAGGYTRAADGVANRDHRTNATSDGSSGGRHDSGGDRSGTAAASGDGGRSGVNAGSHDVGGSTGSPSDGHGSGSGDARTTSGTSSSSSGSGDGGHTTSGGSGSSGSGDGSSGGGSGSGDTSTAPSTEGR